MAQPILERARAGELDAADPLAGYRDRFALDDPSLIYLNGNSLGALPLATTRRLESMIRSEWGGALTRSWEHWVDLPERAGDLVGALIGAAPGQVVVTDNTTVNLYKLACAALDARPGRHVIVTDQDNFPSDRYVVEGIAAQRGAELRLLATDLSQGLARRGTRLDQLLLAQQPRSNEHDEMLFIVIHQIYELWFKQSLHELGKLQSELESGGTSHAVRTLRRALAIMKIVVAQLDVLETMTPRQFTRFRDGLGTSSGFESAQFRELEAVLGRRDPMMVAAYAQGSAERERISAAMSRPSVFDSFVRYLAGQGYQVPAQTADRDVSQALQASDAMQQVLKKVYDDDSDAAAVCELLVDLDEGLQEWRYRHVKMVERRIDARHGTGGSPGASYLTSTLGKPTFPDLWAMRSLG